MGAKTDFEPLSWEEAEENRHGMTETEAARIEKELLKRGEHSGRVAIARQRSSLLSPQDECERLRAEIKRGKEYLVHVQRELNENRSLLEDWPTFEHHCGRNPLAHLTETVMINERIADFLTRWIDRQEKRLTAAARALPIADRPPASSTARAE